MIQLDKEIVRRLAGEFIETSLETLEDIESRLLRLDSSEEIGAEQLADFKRALHSIKGQGTRFGFPLITRIAHRLEDYLALAQRADANNARDICFYLGRMIEILRAGRTPSPEESEGILRALPTYRAQTASPRKFKNIRVHLVMLTELHARIVGQELSSRGILVTRSDNSANAFESVLDAQPDIVIASQELNGFSGTELARAVQSFDATRHIRFVLLRDSRKEDPRSSGLPREAAPVGKNMNYIQSLGELLLKWDVFLPAKQLASPSRLLRT